MKPRIVSTNTQEALGWGGSEALLQAVRTTGPKRNLGILHLDVRKGNYTQIHKSKKMPTRPPRLRQAVRWIAQLGGFLARKSDKEPGVKTIWRGLRRLNDLATGWKLQSSTNYE